MRAAKIGKECYVVRLMNAGKREKAVEYMAQHGMTADFRGAPEYKRPGEGALNLATGTPVPVEAPTAPDAADFKYPDFRPIRDPLPEGVFYAKIKRELGHELQKVVTYEDDFHLPEHKRREALLWITLREQADYVTKRGRLIGQVVAIERNPDDRQGGFRLWRR